MEFLAGIASAVCLWSVLSSIVNRKEEIKNISNSLKERREHLISLKRERLDPYISWLDKLIEEIENVDRDKNRIIGG